MAALAALAGCGGGGVTRHKQDDGEMREKLESGEVTPNGEQEDVESGGSAVGAAQENAEDESEAEAEEVLNLAGTSFSILGDSISTFEGYNPEGYYAFFPGNGEVTDVADTWWRRAADDLGLVLYVNGSSSGSMAAGDSTGTENPQCACNELRVSALSGPDGACPDRIVIYMGTNDMLTTVPLGDNDGTSPVEEGVVDTFSDAYTLMLDKLQANYPSAKLYCCTLLPIGDYGVETPYVEFVNGARLAAADYGAVIARIAKNRGLSVIDLYDCGVTIENLQEMTTDGVHPNAAGMRCIAEAVEKALAGE